MVALVFLFLNLVASLFKSRSRLEAENAALRQQLIVLQRKVRGRVEFTNSDRLFFIQLYRWFPSILKAITTFRPETLVCPAAKPTTMLMHPESPRLCRGMLTILEIDDKYRGAQERNR